MTRSWTLCPSKSNK